MASTTGIIVAAGAITYANQVLGNGRSWAAELRIPVATGAAAVILALLEHASAPLAVGIAWIALITSLLVTPAGGRSAVTNLISITGLGASK